MSTTYRPLETEYRKYGYIYKQVKREGNVAMFVQINEETNKEVGYEVFEVLQLPEQYVGPGRYYQPPRETPPLTSQWGVKGFSPRTIEQAEIRFKQLLSRVNRKRVNS